MSIRKFILTLCSLLAALPSLSAQNKGQTDSVVVLMNATSLQLIEDKHGNPFRLAVDARFLHNNTYLICDSALWNVDQRLINAYGHVQIIQDRTVLSSERLDYIIDDDLAQFRGSLVQLMDKDGNTLRTRFLDYNTRDSIAVFERGGSMRDKDGQVIESESGTYNSKEKSFVFDEDVNMYTDSVYVKTEHLTYHTDTDFAEFTGDIDAWKDSNMLSSETGTYDKSNERFFFTGNVHVMSDTQEGWSDSLYYDRNFNNVEMYGNIQVTDDSRKVSALGERLVYVDSLSLVTLENNAAVAGETDQDGKIDTVYVGAGKFVYRTVQKCDIDGNLVSLAEKRLSDIASDPVSSYRAKAAEEAAKDAQAAKDLDDPNDPEAAAQKREKAARDVDVESLKIAADSLSVNSSEPLDEAPSDSIPNGLDSLAIALDSLVPALDSLAPELDSVALALAREQEILDSLANRDTTRIGFLTAVREVKLFRSDMQVACDSLEYCDLDSLARLFISPIVWNEDNRQYTSDSLTIAIKDQRMEKASLMSNAFIAIQEDSLFFDQIKATEILAYFDTTTALSRFDALGGANALFFLQENDAYATVNKVESKMLSALFKDGDIDRVFYFDSPKNDAYPVVQLPKEDRRMKGFNWQPELRPKGREDITTIELRSSERTDYLAHPMPLFTQTEKYFPGHMASIKKMLASQDSIRRARHAEDLERQRMEEELAAAEADSLEMIQQVDSLSVLPDSVDAAVDTLLAAADSLLAAADTLVAAADSAVMQASSPDPAAERRAAAEAKRQAKIDAREARWAELDARDALKEARKAAKATEKKRQRTYKAVLAAEKEAAKDNKKFDRYIEKYQRQRDRKEQRR
ncbi:MAG: OstA-like protein [Bacteroidia bacterium]|nr:OstA-like protein [Bacteroidia bacterium]